MHTCTFQTLKMAKKHNEHQRLVVFAPYIKPIYMGGGNNAHSFVGFLRSKKIDARLVCKSSIGKPVQADRLNGVIQFRWYNNLLLKSVSLIWIFAISTFQCSRSTHVFFVGVHFPAMPFLLLISKLFQKKVVFRSTLQGDDDPISIKSRKGLMGWLLRFSINKIDVFHAISPNMAYGFRKSFRCNARIVETVQGINTNIFNTQERANRDLICKKHGIESSHFIICSVGFIINRKGFPEIYNIVNGLQGELTYLVVGNELFETNHPLRYMNSEVVKNVNMGIQLLGKNVKFTGPINEIEEVFSLSNIILLNSNQEGIPNVLIEAMACGTVPVAKRIVGVTDHIIAHGINGFLFDQIDEARTIIQMLMHNRVLLDALSQNAAEYAAQKFSFETVWSKLNV